MKARKRARVARKKPAQKPRREKRTGNLGRARHSLRPPPGPSKLNSTRVQLINSYKRLQLINILKTKNVNQYPQ